MYFFQSLKKIVLIVFGIVLIGISTVYRVQAQNLGIDKVHNAAEGAGYERATETTFSENVGRAITILFSILGVLFTILIIYAGYLWMTARGNDEQVSKAKNILSSSIIGLIILLMAYSISNFVIKRVLEGSIQSDSGMTPIESVE